MNSHQRTFLPVLLLAATMSHAHIGDIIYPIYEIPPALLPDLHDGTLEDWEEAIPFPLTHEDFTPEGTYTFDVDEFAFRMFLGWSAVEQRVYVGVDRIDDRRLPEGDSFRIAIDGDHSGGEYNWGVMSDPPDDEELRRLVSSQVQRYTVREPAPLPGWQTLSVYPREASWALLPPYTDLGMYSYGEEPGRWIIELAITLWDELGFDDPSVSRVSALVPGRIIGLYVSMIDADDVGVDGSVRYVVVMNLPDHSFYEASIDASFFADAELISCYQPGCSGTVGPSAVITDSWGRIKASFKHN